MVVSGSCLWASVSNDLQFTVGWFTGECKAAAMGISTSESKSMVHREKEVDYPHWVGLEMTSEELPSIL